MNDKCPKCELKRKQIIGLQNELYDTQIERDGYIARADRFQRLLDHAQARYDALRICSETTIGQLRQKIEYLEGRVKELEALLPLCKQILEWDEMEWGDDGAGFDSLKPALIELRAAYALAARKESL